MNPSLQRKDMAEEIKAVSFPHCCNMIVRVVPSGFVFIKERILFIISV